MEWSDIRVFLHVARQGAIAAAAAPLGMDQATVSRRICRLEKEVGVRCFERAGRRLVITQEGRRLVEAAEKLEAIILRDITSLADREGPISGRVRVGAPEAFGAYYLAQRLARLLETHPDLEIELVTPPKPPSLATREVDLLVTTDRPSAGDIRFKKLTSYVLGFYGASGYFGGRTRPSSAEDLVAETWCEHIGERERAPASDLPPASSVKYRMTSASAHLSAVLSGAALARLPGFVARHHPELERLVSMHPTLVGHFWIAVHNDLAESPRVRVVREAICQQVGRDRALFHDLDTAPRSLPPRRSGGADPDLNIPDSATVISLNRNRIHRAQ